MRRWVFVFWVAILSAFTLAPAGAATPAAETDAQFEKTGAEPEKADAQFEELAARIAGSEHLVGLAVAVVRDGEPTLIRTWGPRELGGTEPIDPQTVFRIASLSKGFATSLIAQLVAEGKLKLTAHAADYAPGFRLKDRRQLKAATLENVMSHRLGLPPHAYDNLLEANMPPSRILRRLGKVNMVCRVGDCYGYQNVAFNMLADVIEAADGRPIGEAMAARLFKPLGMETASLDAEGLRRTGNWARPHRRRKGKSWRLSSVRPNWYRLPAAAGVNASITDMTRWLAAQMGHAPEVLSPEMLSTLHEPRVQTPSQRRRWRYFLEFTSAHYGLGWRVYNYRGETVVSHTGSVDGYASQMTFLPSRNAGIVLLANSKSQSFYSLMPIWLNLELGLPPFPEQEISEKAEEEPAAPAGETLKPLSGSGQGGPGEHGQEPPAAASFSQ
ncbi:MAG: serine hydrolase domain-containing protein [Alphaproteobacteria bacterium]